MATENDDLIKEIVGATKALNTPLNPDQRRVADGFLKEFQGQNEAWYVAEKILQQVNYPTEAHFYASQTIRVKVCRNLLQLPDDARRSLWNGLLEHLIRYSRTPGKFMVVTQLSLAVASFAVQLFEEWPDSIKFLIEHLSDKHALSLLTILEIIPEECRSDAHFVMITGEKYIKLYKYFGKYATGIMKLLTNYLQASGTDRVLQKRIFGCFDKWVAFSDEIPPEMLINTPMLSASFEALKVPELFETCVEAIISAIVRAEKREYMPVVEKLLPCIIKLKDPFLETFETQDTDIAKGLCRIFSQAGESFLDVVVQGTEASFALMQIIIKCLSYPDRDVAGISFTFWSFFCPSIRHSSVDTKEQRMNLFAPAFVSLVETLSSAMQYPKDFDTLHASEKDEISDFRYDCSECLRDAGSCMKEQLLMDRIFKGICDGYAKFQQSAGDIHELESWLHCLRSVAKVVDKENKTISEVMKLVPKLPTEGRIRYTATLILGRYAHWLRDHPEFLKSILQYVVEGLNIPQVDSAAARAFRFVCESCAESIIQQNFFAPLVDLYKESSRLGPDEQREIIEGIIYVIASLPPDKGHQRLRDMTIMPANDAYNILRGHDPARGVTISTSLDRVGHIFKCAHFVSLAGPTPDRNPVVEIYGEMKSIFDKTIEKYPQDEQIMEKVIKCLRYVLRCSSKNFAPHVVPLLNTVDICYRKHPHSCFLYLASICVDEYSHFEQFRPILQKILTVFVPQTFKILKDKPSFIENPDIAEDFFRLAGRYLMRCPELLYSSDLFLPIFQCGVVGLGLQHYDASKIIVTFFIEFVKKGIPSNDHQPTELDLRTVQHTLIHSGSALMSAIVDGIYNLPHVNVNNIARILEALVALSKEHTGNWLGAALERMHNLGDPTVKEKFLAMYMAGQNLHDRFKAIRFLEKACDLYREAHPTRRIELKS